jgi:nicotinamidase-related amidase
LKIKQSFINANQPVIYIKQASSPELGFLVKDTKGADFHPEILPFTQTNEYVVDKTTPNSFYDTTLQKILEKEQIEQVVIVGMMTNVCVDSTTRQANELGFNPIVISDACCGPNVSFNGVEIDDQTMHTSFMAALQNFAEVLPSFKGYSK